MILKLAIFIFALLFIMLIGSILFIVLIGGIHFQSKFAKDGNKIGYTFCLLFNVVLILVIFTVAFILMFYF